MKKNDLYAILYQEYEKERINRMLMQNKMVNLLFTAFAAAGILFFALGLVLGITKEPALFIMCVFGAIFAAVGLIPLLRSRKKQNAEAALLADGRRVNAVITKIETNTAITVNGRHPVNLVCQSTDETPPKTYRSKNIYTDIVIPVRMAGVTVAGIGTEDPKIDSSLIGQPITVYVSPEDPKRYLVDVSPFIGA